MNGNEISLTELLTPAGCSTEYEDKIKALLSLWKIRRRLFLWTDGEMAAFRLMIEDPGCSWKELKEIIKKHLPEIQQVQAVWTIDNGEVKQLNRPVDS
jgi:hypothetical protein